MTNTDQVRQILIQRYSKLSNVSVEKARSKFEYLTIDGVIVRHERALTFSIVLLVIIIVALIAQFVSLYMSKNVTFTLITNVCLLVIFQKGLHDNYEIKEILKTLKEIGVR